MKEEIVRAQDSITYLEVKVLPCAHTNTWHKEYLTFIVVISR